MATKKDDSLHMYSYWRDKYSTVTALREHFPLLLEKDSILATAAANMEINRAAIEQRIEYFKEKYGEEVCFTEDGTFVPN
jgi:hypothetical protein